MKKIIIIVSLILLLMSCSNKINNINDNNVTLSGTNNLEESMIINNKVKQNNLLSGSIKQNEIISNTGAEVFNNKNKSTINYNTGSKLLNDKIKDLGNGFILEKKKDYSKLMYKGKDILYFGSLFTKENYINSISKINDRFYKIGKSNKSITLFDSKKMRISFYKPKQFIKGLISNEAIINNNNIGNGDINTLISRIGDNTGALDINTLGGISEGNIEIVDIPAFIGFYKYEPNHFGVYPTFSLTKDLIKSQLVQKYLNVLQDYGNVYKKNDLLITKNNENLFLELFKSKILPSLFHKKVGKKDIFYTTPYFIIGDELNMINNGRMSFSCGEGSIPGGDPSSVCIIIIKDGDKYYIDSSYMGIFESNDKNGNLLFSQRDGDGCAGVSKYSLTDFKLNKIGSLTYVSGGCQASSDYYKKDNKAISFDFYTDKLNSSGFMNYKKGDFNMIKYYSGSELYRQEVYLKSVYNFDISGNILNNGFTFEINNKKKVLDINNIKNYKKISIFNNIINLSLEKDNTGVGDYNLIGFFEVGPYNDFKKIEVLSCKNNTKFYDNTWYELKKFDKNSGRFLYRISEKFGNKCDIPYKIRYYLNDNNKEKVIDSEYNLIFNKY